MAAAAPQQLLPPVLCVTRKAACPYFSLTISLILASGMMVLLFAELNQVLRLERLITGAALGIKKLHHFAQGVRVGGVTPKPAHAFDLHQIFILELFHMVAKRSARVLSA